MSSAVCTLFEGNYHHGVAALINSLNSKGFKGQFFAGYRGDLPSWALMAEDCEPSSWNGGKVLHINQDIQAWFLPLQTNYHLTNYKPNFMISLFNCEILKANNLFYFDPDIIVTQPWELYEEWISYGITLCEDVNSPFSRFHPRRLAWKKFFQPIGITLSYKGPEYANGGFVGISRLDYHFLEIWQEFQEKISPIIGGLSSSCFSGNKLHFAFSRTDQDTLNCAVEKWNGRITFIGKDGMGFNPGMAYMAHSLGQPKPWNWNVIERSLRGIPPSFSVKEYWKFVEGPVYTYSRIDRNLKKLLIKLGGFIGRFYKRT